MRLDIAESETPKVVKDLEVLKDFQRKCSIRTSRLRTWVAGLTALGHLQAGPR